MMSRQYPVENLLREATEIYSAMTLLSLAFLAYQVPNFLLLTQIMGKYAACSLSGLGVYRAMQAYRVKRYQWRLIAQPYFAMSTVDVPLSKQWLFVGRGFRWLPIHTQRLHQIKQVINQAFTQRSKGYQMVREFCKNHETSKLIPFLNAKTRLNPFRPDPDVGGKPYLHGVGNSDKPIYIPQNVRVGHTFVLGTTRVGKTRLASILINQDIRCGDAVIVVDPKGDLELVRDMYSACKASQRLDDFHIVHLGFPHLSAQYNPLKHFDQVSEVATRITDAIAAEGEGKQFADFAWKYVNIVAICLEEMQEPITYKSIAFYISRLDQLLMAYADSVLPKRLPGYIEAVAEILAENDAKLDKNGKPVSAMSRTNAVMCFLQKYITDTIASGNVESLHDQILIDLFDAAVMDKTYYSKITASIGPVLSKINKSNASSIFSFHKSHCEIELMASIKQKKVIYIGLDSLTNPEIAQAVGKAFLSDLVSTAGKIYKESGASYRLNLHCDELSEIIQDSFVKILNKAGGAGFQVTAYAQTKQDLEVALGSKAKAEVTKGNLNTLIMLRVENEETANLLVNVLPKVDVVSHTEVSTVSDTPHGEEGVFFNTTNEDRVQKTAISMLEINDITSLPKGQAFVLVNGGELYKVRIPLPMNDGLAPKDITTVMRKINHIPEPEASNNVISKEQDISNDSHMISNFEALAVSQAALAIDAVNEAESHHPISEETQVLINEPVKQIAIDEAVTETQLLEDNDILPDFISWLEKRIESGNRQFCLEAQSLVMSDSKTYGNHYVFILPEVLAKYEARSGISSEAMEQALSKKDTGNKQYFTQIGNQGTKVLPVKLTKSFETHYQTIILEGKSHDNIH